MCGLCFFSQGNPRMSGAWGEWGRLNAMPSVWLPEICSPAGLFLCVTRQRRRPSRALATRGHGRGSESSNSCLAKLWSMLSSAPESIKTESLREWAGVNRVARIKGWTFGGFEMVRLTSNLQSTAEHCLLKDNELPTVYTPSFFYLMLSFLWGESGSP